jgi:hypothetical protein
MPPSTAATRRLLVLCGLLPLAEMTQEEVDYLFRRAVEDALTDLTPRGAGEPEAWRRPDGGEARAETPWATN